MASFSVEAMVRDYHVYKDIWATVVGEEFPHQHEDGNRADPFAVAVVRGEAIVGHVPKKISVCALYLRWGLGRPEVANIDTTPSLLLFCAPRARIKILTSSKFHMEKNFVV